MKILLNLFITSHEHLDHLDITRWTNEDWKNLAKIKITKLIMDYQAREQCMRKYQQTIYELVRKSSGWYYEGEKIYSAFYKLE